MSAQILPRQLPASALRVGDVIIEHADGHTAIDTVTHVASDIAPAGGVWVHVRTDRVSVYREPGRADDYRRNVGFVWPALGADVVLTVLTRG